MRLGRLSTNSYECSLFVTENACEECPPSYLGLPLYDEKQVPKGQTFNDWNYCAGSSPSSLNQYVDVFLKEAGDNLARLEPIPGDPYFGKVALLLHMDGTLQDESENNSSVVSFGDANFTSENKLYGTHSVRLGEGNYHIDVSGLPAGYISGDFTIEFWIRIDENPFANNSNDKVIFSTFPKYSLIMRIVKDGEGRPIVGILIGDGDYILDEIYSEYNIPTSEWVHIAIVRKGYSLKYYENGVQRAYTNSVPTGSGTEIVIGYDENNPFVSNVVWDGIEGYIDELRITLWPRYDVNFNPPKSPFPNSKSNPETLLLLHFDGDLVDSGSKNMEVMFGGAFISSERSKFGGTSGYFDGISSGISITNNALFDMTGVEYCFEAWIYPTSSSEMSIFNRCSGLGSPGLSIQKLANNAILFSTGDNWDSGTSVTVQNNTWNHIACTFDGLTKRVFINGILAGFTSGSWSEVSTDMAIGDRPSDYRRFYFQGYIDEVCITKGAARYLGNFVPPTSPYNPITDFNFNKVSLLLHFDGQDKSTTFYDSSQNNLPITSNGKVNTSAVQSRFGEQSAQFTSSTQSHLIIRNDDLSLGLDDFAIEGWVWPDVINAQGVFLNLGTQLSSGTPNTEFAIGIVEGSEIGESYPHAMIFLFPDANFFSYPITNQEWHHFALTREGNTFRAFLDGVNVGERPLEFGLASNEFIMGRYDNIYFNGFLDDIRVTRGLALYNSNFSPPNSPLEKIDINPCLKYSDYDLNAKKTHRICGGPYINQKDCSSSPCESGIVLSLDFEESKIYGQPSHDFILLTFEEGLVDSGPKYLTVNHNPQYAQRSHIVSDEKKFGDNSLELTGTSGQESSVYLQQDQVFSFGSGDFTIETWILLKGWNSNPITVFDGKDHQIQNPGRSESLLLALVEDYQGSNSCMIVSDDETKYIKSSNPIPINKWHHHSLMRKNGILFWFVDGNFIGSVNLETNISSAYCGIGPLFGYIDNYMVVKGVAKTELEVPGQPFQNQHSSSSSSSYGQVSLLLHMDGTEGSSSFADSGPKSIAITNNNAIIRTNQSVFGGASGYFEGNSWLNINYDEGFDFGHDDFTVETWIKIESHIYEPELTLSGNATTTVNLSSSGGSNYTVDSVSVTDGGSGYSEGMSLAFYAGINDETVANAQAVAIVVYDEPKNVNFYISTTGGSGAILSPIWELLSINEWSQNYEGRVKRTYRLSGITVIDGGNGYSNYERIYISFDSDEDGIQVVGAFMDTDLVGVNGSIQSVYIADEETNTPGPSGKYIGSQTDTLESVDIISGGIYYKKQVIIMNCIPSGWRLGFDQQRRLSFGSASGWNLTAGYAETLSGMDAGVVEYDDLDPLQNADVEIANISTLTNSPPTPIWWFDANDSSTITTIDGKVSEWRSKVGSTTPAFQSNPNYRPMYTIGGRNGRNTIDFNSQDRTYLRIGSWQLPSLPVSQPFTIIWVGKVDPYSDYGGIRSPQILQNGDKNLFGWNLLETINGTLGFTTTNAFPSTVKTTTETAYRQWSVVTAIFNTTSSKLRANGVQVADGDCGNGLNTYPSLEMGGFHPPADINSVYIYNEQRKYFFDGPWGELLLYSGILTDEQCLKIESDLAIKFDVALSNSPYLFVDGNFSVLSTNYGEASLASTITVSGSGLTSDITATAPTGFEVSSNGSSFSSTSTFSPSNGNVSGTLYVRLASTTPDGTYSGNVVLSSAGATTVNAPVPSSTVYPYVSPDQFPIGSWKHIAAFRKNGILHLSVDGEIVAISSDPTNYDLSVEPLLLIHFDGNFLDSSNNSLPILTQGDIQTSFSESKFGGGSGYFNGVDGNYLDVQINSDFLEKELTIEVWVRLDSSPYTRRTIIGSIPHYHLQIAANSSGNVEVWTGDGNSWTGLLVSNISIANGTWNHVAVTLGNEGTSVFCNGSPAGKMSQKPSGSVSLRIGAISWSGGFANSNFFGHMDELRIVQGAVLYASNFTPPSGPFSGLINSTLEVGKINGYMDELRIIKGLSAYSLDFKPETRQLISDSSPLQNVVVAHEGAGLTKKNSRSGRRSAKLSGSSKIIAQSNHFNIGFEEFSIDFWLRAESLVFNKIITLGPAGMSLSSSNFQGGLRLVGPFNQDIFSNPSCLQTDQWHHIVVLRRREATLECCNNNLNLILELYVDGLLKGSAQYNGHIGSDNITIGENNDLSFEGNVDDLRFIVGSSNYEAEFDPNVQDDFYERTRRPYRLSVNNYDPEMHVICDGPHNYQGSYVNCDLSSSSSSAVYLFPFFELSKQPDGSISLEITPKKEGIASGSSSSSSSYFCLPSPPPVTQDINCPDGKIIGKIYYLPDFSKCSWEPYYKVYGVCEDFSSSSSSFSCNDSVRYCLYSNFSLNPALFSLEEKPPPCQTKPFCYPDGCREECALDGTGTPLVSCYGQIECCIEGYCLLDCSNDFMAPNCVVCGLLGGLWFGPNYGDMISYKNEYCRLDCWECKDSNNTCEKVSFYDRYQYPKNWTWTNQKEPKCDSGLYSDLSTCASNCCDCNDASCQNYPYDCCAKWTDGRIIIHGNI